MSENTGETKADNRVTSAMCKQCTCQWPSHKEVAQGQGGCEQETRSQPTMVMKFQELRDFSSIHSNSQLNVWGQSDLCSITTHTHTHAKLRSEQRVRWKTGHWAKQNLLDPVTLTLLLMLLCPSCEIKLTTSNWASWQATSTIGHAWHTGQSA